MALRIDRTKATNWTLNERAFIALMMLNRTHSRLHTHTHTYTHNRGIRCKLLLFFDDFSPRWSRWDHIRGRAAYFRASFSSFPLFLATFKPIWLQHSKRVFLVATWYLSVSLLYIFVEVFTFHKNLNYFICHVGMSNKYGFQFEWSCDKQICKSRFEW